MNPFLKFGKTVRLIRLQRGMSQRMLGIQSHIHPNTISRIEHGKHNIRLEQIGQLAKALKVTPAKLCKSI